MVISINPVHTFTFNEVTTNVYNADTREGLPRHEHTTEHITFVVTGKIIIRKENKELIADKDTMPVMLRANEWHEIEALEDNTVFINVI